MGASLASVVGKFVAGHQCKLQESQKTVRHCRQSGLPRNWVGELPNARHAQEWDAVAPSNERTWKLLTDENRRPRSVREPLNQKIVSQDPLMPVDVDSLVHKWSVPHTHLSTPCPLGQELKALREKTGINIHQGKTKLWNKASIKPSMTDALTRAARVVKPDARFLECPLATLRSSQLTWQRSSRNKRCAAYEFPSLRMCKSGAKARLQ